jgi:arylsulfatase A-like enzyme
LFDETAQSKSKSFLRRHQTNGMESMMNNRTSLAFFAIAMALLAVSCAAPSKTATASAPSQPAGQARPNVIFIVADDLGYGDIGANGGTVIKTPNIDALAKSGIRFTDGYVTAAVCAPSRAALMSGQHQARYGYQFNPRGRDEEGIGPDLNLRFAPDRLREAGYRTMLVGKWHLGKTPELHPMSRGFQEFFGFTGGGTGFMAAPAPDDEWMENSVEGSRPGFRPMILERGREALPPQPGYLTEILSNEAVSFIERNKDGPFFLTLAHHAPHTPLQATKKYLDRYRNIEDKPTRIYAAMTSALDDSVGQIVATLDRLGIREKTLIVFLSDNGCAQYIGPGRCSNSPLQGFKGTYFDGGIRVPMIASWPGRLQANSTYSRPVLSMDWTATAMSLAGIDLKDIQLDGRNLLPFLNGSVQGGPHDTLVWETSPNFAVRQGRWKMWIVERADKSGTETFLYDLETDLGETRNLAAQRPDIVSQLTAIHTDWAKSNVAPKFDSQRRGNFPNPDNGVVVNVYN